MAANRAERRASGAKYPTSLDAWSHDVLIRGLPLPKVEGGPERMVDFEVPDLAYIASRGEGVPNPIAEMAARVEGGGVRPSELQPEERRTYFDLMCYVIATRLRKPNLVEQLGSEEAAIEWVATKMPAEHRLTIWQRAVHVFSPEDIASFLEMVQGTLPEEVKGSDLNSVTDLERFRDGAGSPGGSEGGGDPGPGSERAAEGDV